MRNYIIKRFLQLIPVLILVSIFLREKRKAHVAFGMICIAAGAASIVYSINDVWAALDVKDYLKNQSTYNTVVEDNYVDPDRVNITFPEQKRNLIYLYLESNGEHLRRQSLRRSIR